ncbi:hypothetical protein [Streptoalloteichus hindustanus]|uniref:Uncharacterized protein n=1 Tax=Streptoalloteichus hindustanus TaxID=2017 RepID=A0A1M5DQ51_STRHI|nr:hypothetical protein [Streptoalloteichus hindustanus]SHF69103.1 hypothetical protein SAMN05444320_104557 [Streptoalloteichus hindustanus]
MATQFFSPAEIRKLESWPVESGRDELVQHFTLTPEEPVCVDAQQQCLLDHSHHGFDLG